MKPVNPHKERIIVLVGQILSRAGLSIDQVVARMQIDGCSVSRSTFENRFTTRVHQKPTIPPDWFLSLIRAVTHNLTEGERCTAEEALELCQLARLPLDQFAELQQLFPEQELTTAISKLLPLSYVSTSQTTINADNLLTDVVRHSSALIDSQIRNLSDISQATEWGDAPDVTVCHGRIEEMALLRQWIAEAGCRLIGIFGMGGSGKTLLASQVAHELQTTFAQIYWVSLRNAPQLPQLLGDCLQFLLGLPEELLPTTVNKRNALLLRHLRATRCLLILDSYEFLGETGDNTGGYRIGYEHYAQWLRQITEVAHQSCILLTSREKPLEFTSLANATRPVRSLVLQGLDLAATRTMLEAKGLHGTATDWQRFHQHYSGNPLALQLAAESINELFAGDLAAFLHSNASLFQAIRTVLDQQFARLSLLEREVLYWLVIEREAVTIELLQENIGQTVPKLHLLEALRSLLRRSFIEQKLNHFVAPTLIQSYMLERLIELVVSEIEAGIPLMLAGFALLKTQIKEYLRTAQRREITEPILARLLRFATHQEIEHKLLDMLHTLQRAPSYQDNYAAGNLFNLLGQLNTDLRGQDFSTLEIHQGDFRTSNLQDVNFANATFHGSRFWESFASIAALAYSPNGNYIAAGMTNGEVYLWALKDWALRYRLSGHTDMIWSVTFSADSSLLATGCEDETVRVWNVASGECLLHVTAHDGWVKSVCFLAGNAQLATAGHDAIVRIWDIASGACVKSWPAHDGWIWSIAASPDGTLLATASQDHTVKLWSTSDYRCVRILSQHTEPVRTIAFAPHGQTLLSAGFDQIICVWDVVTGRCRHILRGHENLIWSAAFSPTGTHIVSGGDDAQILLWDAESGRVVRTLEGHQNRLWAVAFHPDGNVVASGGDDQRLWFWNCEDGQPLRYLEGYSNQIWAIAYHAAAGQLASGGDDGTIRLWDHRTARCRQLLQGHTERVRGVAFSPDGTRLATGSDDHTVRIWDVQHNLCLQTLYGHQNRVWSVCYDTTGQRLISCSEDQTIRIWRAESGQPIRTLYTESGRVWTIACHPTKQLLASGGDGNEILLWDLDSGQCVGAWEGHSARVWQVSFNHDGSLLASGGADRTVCIWETATGTLVHQLRGHEDAVWSVAFSPDGQQLASGSDDQRICIWDVATGALRQSFTGHEGCVWTVAFLENQLLASGSQDETIRLWQLAEGKQQQILRSERPYERMNITGVKGLTEAQKSSLRALGAVEQ